MAGYAKLDPTKTLFLLCDVQEKFRKAIPLFGNMVQNISKLMRIGRAFEVPLIATEQYPKGIGNTVKELDVSHALAVIPKTKFSMYLPETLCYIKELIPTKPEHVVVFGLETHICVLQTCMDFLENDFKVHIVADCCASRLNQDRDISLNLMRQIGSFVQTSETVIFNLLQDKDDPHFDTVRKSVGTASADMELAKIPTKIPITAPPTKPSKPPEKKVEPKKPPPVKKVEAKKPEVKKVEQKKVELKKVEPKKSPEKKVEAKKPEPKKTAPTPAKKPEPKKPDPKKPDPKKDPKKK